MAPTVIYNITDVNDTDGSPVSPDKSIYSISCTYKRESRMSVHEQIRQRVFDRADHHVELLRSGLEASFSDVETFQEWVTDRLDLIGASTEQFTLSHDTLGDQSAFQEQLNTDPESIRLGSNVVGHFPGNAEATTLVFAHADKAPVSYQHVAAGHGIKFNEGRLVGPGIADDVSGVTAAISAIDTLAESGREPATSVMIASILGKQLGVGGTYGLMRRYGPAQAAVYTHPAESGQGLTDLKIGSNGMYEFVVEVEGSQPTTSEVHHPLYQHQGVNPIDVAGEITDRLHGWTDELAAENTHPGVEEVAGTSAGLLVSDIQVDDENRAVYEMPRRSLLRAVLAFPPGVTLDAVTERVQRGVNEAAAEAGTRSVSIRRGDHVADSAEAPTGTAAVRTATDSITAVTDHEPVYYYGHTASDIRYPMLYWDAPTVGFGPRAGAMGAPDEWIDRREYLETISALAVFLVNFEPAA